MKATRMVFVATGWVVIMVLACFAGTTRADPVDYFVDASRPDDEGNGLDWTTAKQTIQAAVDLAGDGDTVWVTNGFYGITSEILIDKGVTVRGFAGGLSGARETIVARTGTGNTRIFRITHADAVLDSLTISNGYLTAAGGFGGGIHMTGGTVQNCRIVDNEITPSTGEGGGVYMDGGLLRDSELTGNRNTHNHFARGGAVCLKGGAIVERCRIWGNRAGSGGGIYIYGSGTVRNCLVVGNQTDYNGLTDGVPAGAVGIENSSGILENSTIVGNQGYGVYTRSGGTIRNCIVYYNRFSTDIDGPGANMRLFGSPTVVNTCTIPATGSNATDKAPEFIDAGSGYGLDHVQGNYRLRPGSPALNTGVHQAWMDTATDLDGLPRIDGAAVDMGAFEARLGEGALRANLIADSVAGLAPHTVHFTAHVAGANTSGLYYRWDFDGSGGAPDTEGTDKGTVSHPYDAIGRYTVALTVSNADDEVAECIRPDYVLAGPSTLYVSQSGSSTFPYTSWGTAATNLYDALDNALDGATVVLGSGPYTLSRQIMIDTGITVRGDGPREATVLTAPAARRGFHLSHPDAKIERLTVTGGNIAWPGGGVFMSQGTIADCVISNNTTTSGEAGRGGGGLCMTGGTVSDSLITGNLVNAGTWSRGGGIWMSNGTVERCVVTGNRSASGGGGVYVHGGGILRNSLIAGNELTANGSLKGGGVGIEDQNGRVESCTIVGNKGYGVWCRDNKAAVRNTIIRLNGDLNNDAADWLSNFLGTTGIAYVNTTPLPDPPFTGSIDGNPMFHAPGTGYGLSHSGGSYCHRSLKVYHFRSNQSVPP